MKDKLWPILSIFTLSFVLVVWLIDFYQHCLIPTQAEWQQSMAEIKKSLKEKDGITWFPEWAGEGKVSLRAFKDQAFYLPYQGQVDLSAYQRVWLMSTFGYELSDFLAQFEFNQKPKLISRQDIGDIKLYLLEVTEARRLADLYAQLPSVQVYALPPQSQFPIVNQPSKPCDFWDGQAWHCDLRKSKEQTTQCLHRPLAQKLKARSRDRSAYYLDGRRGLTGLDCGLNPLEHIGQDVRVIDGDPRFCVWLPPHQRRDILIQWLPQIDLSLLQDQLKKQAQQTKQAIKLVLQYGWEELVIDHPFRANIPLNPIQMDIQVDDLPILKKSFTPSVQWHSETVLDLTATSTVELKPMIKLLMHAQDKNQDAKFCINLSLRF